MGDGQQGDRILLVFDFDHTMISDNVDVAVEALSPQPLPLWLVSERDSAQWTDYMGALFRHLHQQGVRAADIQRLVERLPLTPGMAQLFEHVREAGSRYDTIIISDANSVLIGYALTRHGLDRVVRQVFTNPARYDTQGCLLLDRYHTQDWCPLSTPNMCKGHILEDFIQRRGEGGVRYSRVVYVGDGSNDLCPGLRLTARDLLLPRRGFSLWKKLEKMRTTPPAHADQRVSATVVPWDSALEIRTQLEDLAAGKASE
ncbi:hypothetical protein ACOMHN_048212 [Nucella lapillus]